MPKIELHVEQLAEIAEVLLGVAYADGRFQAVEADSIRSILAEFAEIDELPQQVVERIHGFDPETFDPGASLEGLEITNPDDQRELLRLVLQVADADKVRDRAEDHYFFMVARAIGASDETIEAAQAE